MDYKDISILFSFIVIASLILNILFLIIAIPLGSYEKKHTQQAEFEPDRIVYYCYKHSKGFKFLVRFICVFAFWLHIPLFAPLIVFEISSAFEIALHCILAIWILSFIGYVLSFKIGRDAPIKSFELTSKGLKVVPLKKNKPSDSYPIGFYKGYEPDLSKLFFNDSKGNAKSIPLKYLSRDDRISITAELAFLMNKGYLRYSKKDTVRPKNNDEAFETNIKVASSFPLKEDLHDVKLVNQEVAVKPVEEKRTEPASEVPFRKSSDPVLPDLSILRNRIFIKNTYRTDMQKVIDSYKVKHADNAIVSLNCDSYPGSAWMYIELKYDYPQDRELIFRNSLEVLKYIKVLDKEMFLYAEGTEGCVIFQDRETSEDRFKMISSGSMFIVDISLPKIKILRTDSSFDDLKAYIKGNYRLDV